MGKNWINKLKKKQVLDGTLVLLNIFNCLHIEEFNGLFLLSPFLPYVPETSYTRKKCIW